MSTSQLTEKEMFRRIYIGVFSSTPEQDAKRYTEIGSVPLTEYFLSKSELPAPMQARILAHANGRAAGKDLAEGKTQRADLKIQRGRELRAAATKA